MAVGVEVGGIHFRQMDVMNADVTRQRQAVVFGTPHHLDAGTAGQAGQVNARAGFPHQQQDGGQRDGFRRHRYRRESQPRGDNTVVRDTLARQMGVLRTQPDRQLESLGVFHRAQQHLRVDQRRVGLAERDAAGLGELGHFGDALALQFLGQRADRVHARPRHVFGTELEHFDQAGFVQRRVGIRRTGQ